MNTNYEKAIMEQQDFEKQDFEKQVRIDQNTSHWYKFHLNNTFHVFGAKGYNFKWYTEKKPWTSHIKVRSDLLLLTGNSM